MLSWGWVSPSYRLCMYYFPSIYFLSLISVSCHHSNLPLTITLRKGETESFLIAAQNNAVRTKYIKVRIDKLQQKSRYRICSDRDEMIRKYSKLEQREYKTKQDWVGKVIHWELCKKFKFDHTNKWYIHKPESVQENETQNFLRFWNTSTSNLCPKTRPSDSQQKKRTCWKWTLPFWLTTG